MMRHDAHASMYAFIGLGNPGRAYENTRHNVGFRVIDTWLHRLQLEPAPVCGAFHAITARVDRRTVLLMKPMTYMNRSGYAVVEAFRRYGLLPDRIVVVSDDVNLPFGTLRLRARGSDGGHNGLASIIAALGTTDFARQRIGVSAPSPEVDRVDYVLGNFTDEEEASLPPVIERACMQLHTFLVSGLAMAASRYNGQC